MLCRSWGPDTQAVRGREPAGPSPGGQGHQRFSRAGLKAVQVATSTGHLPPGAGPLEAQQRGAHLPGRGGPAPASRVPREAQARPRETQASPPSPGERTRPQEKAQREGGWLPCVTSVLSHFLELFLEITEIRWKDNRPWYVHEGETRSPCDWNYTSRNHCSHVF